MRILALILVLALGAQAEDRTAMLERILSTEPGTPVRVRLDDRTVVTGRLLRVENEAIQLQVATSGLIAARDLPLARIASFQGRRDGEFSKGFKKGAGRAAGVLAVYAAAMVLVGLFVAVANH